MKEKVQVLIDQEQYQEGFDLIEKLLSVQYDNLDFLYLKATLYKKLQRTSDAVNQYTYILEIYPEEKRAEVERDLIQMIMIQENNDKFESTNMYDDPWL